jgi:dTDP-4-amino-4,6-dideoxygalactose transaminase
MAERIRVLANYGQPDRYVHTEIGINSRLDTLQAAILLAKLDHLPDWNTLRNKHAAAYDDALGDLPVKLVRAPGYGRSVFHLYVIELDRRDECQDYLKTRGVMAQIHYPNPIHLQACYRDLNYKKGDFPVAESAMSKILSLPMYPELTETQIESVCSGVRDFLGQ